MKKIRVAINGFGRIGRVYLRNCINNSLIDIVIINDLTNAKTLAHLLKYDSIHRKFDGEVKAEGNNLIINGKTIKVVSIKDPESLPWKENDIDIVVECTGHFLDKQSANKHIIAGAKKVVLSAPAKMMISDLLF
jgi:glyceraldehyde 3-phosphate dehydrogenase